jgi:mannose-6-phosphate isomerase-like protein (cupin superfamily)
MGTDRGVDCVVVERAQLREGASFDGGDHGAGDVSFILVDLAPGEGPKLHRHGYAETFVVQEGEATFTAGATTMVARGGQIVVVPAGVPHKFVNTGTGRLRQVDVHAAGRIVTEWLED